MSDLRRREEEVNYAIAGLLREMRVRWNVDSQPAGSAGGKSPDILIRENGASSIIIEHEIMPANTVEQDALSRLGFQYQRTMK